MTLSTQVALSPRGQALQTAIRLLDKERLLHADRGVEAALEDLVGSKRGVVAAEQVTTHDGRAEALADLIGELRVALNAEQGR